MPTLVLELIPARAAGCLESATALDVLIRVTPPQPEVHVLRPPINLGLVLDRSGSMASRGKMGHARDAAIYAVEQLLPTDRVTVVIFDDHVQTIVPSTLATEKSSIVERLRTVQPGGSTALHAGWAACASQVEEHRLSEGLNRVILLSDGLANVGLTDPKAIAADTRARQARGVSTTTMGVGDDYNEDLLQSMAEAGDGNYYYVESSQQLADIFQTELQGLMATVGRDVRLILETRHGVKIQDFLNDFEEEHANPGDSPEAPARRWRLPNLVVGMPIEMVIRLAVPPLNGVTELIRARLNWSDPARPDQVETVGKTLIVPAVSTTEFASMIEDATVRERAVLLEAGRLKLRASAAMASADLEGTKQFLSSSMGMLAALPGSLETTAEIDELRELWADLEENDAAKLMKRAKYQRFWGTRRRKSEPPPGAPNP